MNKEPSDLLTNFFQQTRSGKMSLITLIQNLPDEKLSDIAEITYDENERYLKLKQNNNLQITSKVKSTETRHDALPHSTIPVSPSLSVQTKMSKRSTEEQCSRIAQEFNLSSSDIERQYELALKNRIEIPPILMRRIVIDAIKILRLMIDELNQEIEKHHEKVRRISKRLNELEAYNLLFDQHC